jgi:hypothetical protein
LPQRKQLFLPVEDLSSSDQMNGINFVGRKNVGTKKCRKKISKVLLIRMDGERNKGKMLKNENVENRNNQNVER